MKHQPAGDLHGRVAFREDPATPFHHRLDTDLFEERNGVRIEEAVERGFQEIRLRPRLGQKGPQVRRVGEVAATLSRDLQLAQRLAHFLEHQDLGAASGREDRGHEPGRATAYDDDIVHQRVSFRYLIRCGSKGFRPSTSFRYCLVLGVVAIEEDHLAVALEGQDVGGQAVQEPAVVADDDGAAREVLDGLFQGAHGVHVQVVGGLVEEEHVGAALEGQRQVQAVLLAAGELLHLLLLGFAGEAERG